MDHAQSELFQIKQDLDDYKIYLQNNSKTSSYQENKNADLTQLIFMGFDENSAISALKKCENDVNKAIEFLLCPQFNDILSENNDFEVMDIESKQEMKEVEEENDIKMATKKSDSNCVTTSEEFKEIESKLICFTCKTKWRLENVEWYRSFKICSLCPDNIRIIFDPNHECWICPCCIHDSHLLFQSLSSQQSLSSNKFCKFKCGRGVNPGLTANGNPYTTCCKNCALKKGKLCSDYDHDHLCNKRIINDKYNTNNISLLAINKMSNQHQLYLQYKREQDEKVKFLLPEFSFFSFLMFLCLGLKLNINVLIKNTK